MATDPETDAAMIEANGAAADSTDSIINPGAAREPTEEERAEAEVCKEGANASFKGKKYQQAVDGYSKAIELNPKSAVYFANRAFANIKLENYGAAIADATQAISLDKSYIKGYYRRGDANFAMARFKAAVKDFKTAARVAPKDPDLRRKLAECEREVKKLRFEEAIGSTQDQVVNVSDTIDLTDIIVEDSYTGPRMQGNDKEGYIITLQFVKDMLEEFKNQKLIHRRFALQIILEAQQQFKKLPSLVDVDIPSQEHFTVCGDVHGQYFDLLNIFALNGLPSDSNPYLFNGDFVDRGSFSVEVILTLLAFKVLYPSHFHLVRGNHESKSMNNIYGFDGEVKHKYNLQMLSVFRETFNWLPLAYVLNNKVLVVHGGLFSKDDVSLDDIRKIDRYREPPEDGTMCELLWSDPSPESGRQPSKRGVGVAFGADVTKRFLERNNLELVVRSHEVKQEGYEIEHNGLLVTVFSAPNYCDQMGNKGAFIRFNGEDMVPHFTTFDAVPHPEMKPMAYANQFLWGM